MSIVNFAINQSLEAKINTRIKQDGFCSKAEFFRFLAINYLNFKNKKLLLDDNPDIDKVIAEISSSVKNINTNSLLSLKKQLSDV